MSKESPKLSVCIPVHNPGDLLEAAIKSVLDQEFDEYELLIVDDASTESAEETVAQFDDPRIRFYRFEENAGLAGNWNRCIELSRGEYIAIFHQDDLMLAGNAAEKVAVLDAAPAAGLVYSDIVRIDAEGKEIGGHAIDQPESDCIFPGCELFAMVGRTGNPIACPAVIVRAACYERVGLFDTAFPFATDLEMWLRIASQYEIGFVARPLVAHRIHPGQEGGRYRSQGKDYADVLHVFDRTFKRALPAACSEHKVACYRRLADQAAPLARSRLREAALWPGLLYAYVALRARLKARPS